MAEGQNTATGLIDLEKELSCSICTDIFFQPLTLLDCLHTFCGACLQEWFSFSAAEQREHRSSRHRFTCPSCRATVRGTKHNATVTTLLDMFLQANPGKGKSDKEKEDMMKLYKPGDDVLPKMERRGRTREVVSDEEDQALLSQVREMSLREVGVASGSPGSSSRQRRAPRSSQDESRRRHRTRGGDGRDSPRETPSRQIEHQSSLRSLLSASENDSQEVEAAIMRQIVEEGLLEGVDVNNMTPQQEEELTEMIAQAYYRRRRELAEANRAVASAAATGTATATASRDAPGRSSPRRTQHTESPPRSTARPTQRMESPRRPPALRLEEPAQERRSRSHSTNAVPVPAAPPTQGPPISFRPSGPISPSYRRRSSSQGAARRSSGQTRQSYTSHAAARSATDLSNAPETAEASVDRRARASLQDRRSTDPEGARITRPRQSSLRMELSASVQSGLIHSPVPMASPQLPPSPTRTTAMQEAMSSPRLPPSPRSTGRQSPRSTLQQEGGSSPRAPPSPTRPTAMQEAMSSPRLPPSPSSGTARQEPGSSPQLPPSPTRTTARQDSTGRPSPSSTATTAPLRSIETAVPSSANPSTPPRAAHRPSVFTEPSIDCSKCGAAGIQYDLHYTCSVCHNGAFHLCLPCYRLGKGCLHWFGFGTAARVRFERAAPPGGYPADYPPPHVLTGQRYRRPRRDAVPQPTPTHPSRLVTGEDPAARLERGAFCDACGACANACYWQCGTCNDGAWGYCNACVVRARHCTHPLLALARCEAGAQAPPPTHPPVLVAGLDFARLSFTTACDVCRYPIPPARTRLHCPDCERGNYDICAACYSGLVAGGTIAPVNGEQGWRRCPAGHRMEVVAYEDRGGGLRRVVVRQVVGGWALKDEDVPKDAVGGAPQSSRRLAAPTNGEPGALGPSGSPSGWWWHEEDGTVQMRAPRSPTRAQFEAVAAANGTAAGERRFPPSGGVGLRVQAHWGWFPDADAKNELSFPKGAEIREVEDINGDWFWGVFCRQKGLFPANYGRVL